MARFGMEAVLNPLDHHPSHRPEGAYFVSETPQSCCKYDVSLCGIRRSAAALSSIPTYGYRNIILCRLVVLSSEAINNVER